MKKTLLTIIAALLLGGVVNAQGWGETDSHAKSSNTPIVASVTLDDEAVTPTADYRLGAFVGEELRGLAAPHTDNNFWIQVFYNQGTTETISFKLYDGNNVYTTCSVTQTTQEEGWGTPSEPVVLDFTTTQTQPMQLAQGWTWWSTPIEMEGNNGLQQLENGLGSSGTRIQSRTQYVNGFAYNGTYYWNGSLTAIVNEQMYKINTNAPCQMAITGLAANPANHPISIEEGWNWIGYPYSESINVTTALGGFTPEPNDQIKNRDYYSTYLVYGNNALWYGTLNTLEPGQGYMYKSNSSTTKTLTYQTGQSKALVDNVSPLGNTFMSEEGAFANNMTLTAVVELDGEELRNTNYEVAAFVGDDCRGSAKLMYVEPLDRYMVFLLIAGDAKQTLRFVLTDGKEFSCSMDNIIYSNDDIVGNPIEPAVLHFGPLGIGENGFDFVNVYPNPSNNVFNIEGKNICKIEVISALGQVLYSKEANGDFIKIDLSNYNSGIYTLRVVTNNQIITKQLIKK